MDLVAALLGILGITGAGFLAYSHLKRKGSATAPLDFSSRLKVPLESPVSEKVYKGAFDSIIDAAASLYDDVPPHILKAIVARESSFVAIAINPEKTFTLDGVTYGPGDSKGRNALRAFIMSGGNPLSLGVNPSLGLAQVRLTIGRKVLKSPALTGKELFEPETNLRAAAALLAELFRSGITLDTIDAYNVGADLSPRNFPYRDAVNSYARQFQGDF